MENTQAEELGQSSTKYFHSVIMALLRDYHLSRKVDEIIINIASRAQGR